MGSNFAKEDGQIAASIQNKAAKLGITRIEKHVCSAHKTTAEVLELVTRYEGILKIIFVKLLKKAKKYW